MRDHNNNRDNIFLCLFFFFNDQLLVDSVVISELGKYDHGSIPWHCDRRGLKLLDPKTNLQIRLNW
jgi:hypothetical protein